MSWKSFFPRKPQKRNEGADRPQRRPQTALERSNPAYPDWSAQQGAQRSGQAEPRSQSSTRTPSPVSPLSDYTGFDAYRIHFDVSPLHLRDINDGKSTKYRKALRAMQSATHSSQSLTRPRFEPLMRKLSVMLRPTSRRTSTPTPSPPITPDDERYSGGRRWKKDRDELFFE